MSPCQRQTERVAIGFEQGVGFLADVAFQPAQRDDLAHRLGVVAGRLGLGVDVLDVVGDALLFFLEPLDPLDEQPQLVGRDVAFAHGISFEFAVVM